MFGLVRAHMGIRPRHKERQRTQHTQIYKDAEGNFRSEIISIGDTPISVMGFKWDLPGILTGAVPMSDFPNAELHVAYAKTETAGARSSEGIHLGRFRVDYFARMLAKIAHGYAIASMGYDSFRPFLQKMIRGEASEYHYYIGGYRDIWPADPNNLHALSSAVVRSDRDTRYVAVDIRLFSNMPTPHYAVIVGEYVQDIAANGGAVRQAPA